MNLQMIAVLHFFHFSGRCMYSCYDKITYKSFISQVGVHFYHS